MNDISICSLNCRGLHDAKKRFDVFMFLKDRKYDIYCLQDTHFDDRIDRKLKNEWEGTIFGNSIQKRSIFK